jgi:phosphatidate cytidylyltransferase
MLKQRIITALVLLAVLIPSLLASQAWPFASVVVVLVAAAAWEWGRLNGVAGAGPALIAAVVLLLCALQIWEILPRAVEFAIFGIASIVWVCGAAWALRGGVDGWRHTPRWARLTVGVLVLSVAAVALLRARQVGLGFVLSIFCIVWVADVAAYAAGRAFGRRKLAPAISPGKSWEGVLGAVLAVGLLGWAWLVAQSMLGDLGPSVFSALRERFGVLSAVLLVGLVAMSVVGDLFESLVKRAAGVKDSSGLLPGHGGVLDRIDALLPVFPLVMALTG